MNFNSVGSHSPGCFSRPSRNTVAADSPAGVFKRSSSADVGGPRRSGFPWVKPSAQGAVASSASAQSNGKLSTEMKRAAATFETMVWKEYSQPGMPAIESGKPRTESQAAQKLFAAVVKESMPSNGLSRMTPSIVASLEAGADEIPALAQKLISRRLVDKQFLADFLDGADRAGRALRYLAADPAGVDLNRYLLPAILRLPKASPTSANPLHAGVALDLANQMRRGLDGGGSAVRATPVAHAQTSITAAVAAGLLSKEMGDAVVAEFTKLVPVGAGMDAGFPVTSVRPHIPRAADSATMPQLVSVTPFAPFDASAHRAAMARNAPAEPNRGGAAALADNQPPAVQKRHRARLHETMHRVAAHFHLGRHRVETPAPLRAQAGPLSAREAASLLEMQQLRLVGDLGAQPVVGSYEIEPDEESVIATPSLAYARLAALPR